MDQCVHNHSLFLYYNKWFTYGIVPRSKGSETMWPPLPALICHCHGLAILTIEQCNTTQCSKPTADKSKLCWRPTHIHEWIYLIYPRNSSNSIPILLAMRPQIECKKVRRLPCRSHPWKSSWLLNISGFQCDHLPVRYLGVPLISGRLFEKECVALIDRITS